ncbi:hypothetical protein [Robinsoniella peoriensis]|uniref:hypothetical protein n=1 Tax=Robinsoniella peoriensis TaxID=180332 RepID=UPI00375386AC
MAEMKNICGKIPLDLHEMVRQEIEETQSSTQKFIQQVIEEHFSRGEMGMEKRTLAVQVSEELFGRLKTVIAKMGCKQKDFLIGIIEQTIAEEAARLGLTEPQEAKITEEAEHPEEEQKVEGTQGDRQEPEDEEPCGEPESGPVELVYKGVTDKSNEKTAK